MNQVQQQDSDLTQELQGIAAGKPCSCTVQIIHRSCASLRLFPPAIKITQHALPLC